MRILVDDMRTPEFLGIKGECLVYRTGEDFLLETHMNKDILTLFIDHDLGEGVNGYQVITELVEVRKTKPYSVIIVSSNPVGRDNIGRCLKANGYRELDPSTFVRE